MLSKKMAVSLTSLITILALALTVPSVMAADFDVKIIGPSNVGYTLAATDDGNTSINEATQHLVQLIVESDHTLLPTFPAEITLYVTDKDGLPITADTADANDPDGDETAGYTITITDDTTYAMRTGKKRRLNVIITVVAQLDTDQQTAGNQMHLVKSVVLTIPTFDTPDPSVGDADDSSTAVSHTITLSETVDADALPKVVSIQRLDQRTQTVVAAFQEEKITPDPFYVRIVLTEHPNGIEIKTATQAERDASAMNLVEIQKVGDFVSGVPSDLFVGQPFLRRVTGAEVRNTNTPEDTSLPHPSEGGYEHEPDSGIPTSVPGSVAAATDTVPVPTSDDLMYRQYRVKITPHQKTEDFTIKIRVKEFHDGGSPVRNTYVPADWSSMPNGRDVLSLDVAKVDPAKIKAGYRVKLPKDIVIPAGGYLVVTKNSTGDNDSKIEVPTDSPKAPDATKRTPEQMKYNVQEASGLPNLATALVNGAVIDVEYKDKLVIHEVMWGEDAGLDAPENNQWIELHNPGAADIKTVDDDPLTLDIDERLTLVFYTQHELKNGGVPAGTLPIAITGTRGSKIGTTTIQDRIGTLNAAGNYWSPIGVGQSGQTTVDPGQDVLAISPTKEVISMSRVLDAADAVTDGQVKKGWMQSGRPSTNFIPGASVIRIATPGAAPLTTPEDIKAKEDAEAAKKKTEADKKKAEQEKIRTTGTYPMAGDGRVYISEIMFEGGGKLPQWIEIANADLTKTFNLSKWTLTVNNATADTAVSVGATATFTIPDGTMIAPSKVHDPAGGNMPSTILIVTEAGRNSFSRAKESAQVINLAVDNDVELITAGVVERRWTLLSDEAFEITLTPPVPTATKAPAGETAAAKTQRLADEKRAELVRKAAIDTVGNLGKDGAAMWALPMSKEGARSSIIRVHKQVVRGPKAPHDGIVMEDWVSADATSFAGPTHLQAQSYYGAANDVGTPGFRTGGALPVELSHFRPARDKATGQVVITWSTQSELNNAGFFVKRSQQRTGEFKVINATMVPGAGTTSEKQFYTYTDTTAQPNVVYYYQIEDVSLDGNRQTLTRGIRLKGHVGAAGKATTLWGELKTSHE